LAQGYISFPSKGTSDGHCAEDFATSSTWWVRFHLSIWREENIYVLSNNLT
jgi:hypothetical protein